MGQNTTFGDNHFRDV